MESKDNRTPNQTRFSFYNANDFETTAPTETTDILRSIQAHEQQRLEILGSTPPASSTASNPYEDAIKEALDLLRKHKETPQTPAKSDRILRMRHDDDDDDDIGEVYQAEIKARRKQRQERMARYANRLAELKQDDTVAVEAPEMLLSETNLHPPSAEAPVLETQLPNVESPTAAIVPPAVDPDTKTDETNDDETNDDEVQRGVERVLMAILERASSRSREKRFSFDENEDENSNLVQAMSDLLSPGTDDSPLEASTLLQPPESEDTEESPLKEYVAIQPKQPEPPAEDSILEDWSIHQQRQQLQTPTEGVEELDKVMEALEKQESPKNGDKLFEQVRQVLSNDQEEEDENVAGPTSRSSDSSASSEDDSSGSSSGSYTSGSSSSYETDEDSSDHHAVLGPLGKGATGVVLEPDSPEGHNSGGILESISAAVSIVTGASNEDMNNKEAVSSEAVVLMETLCAHILHRHDDKRPTWDDENPDEPGYRIIRLTTDQLAAVEEAYKGVQLEADDLERDLKAAEAALQQASLSANEGKVETITSDQVVPEKTLDDFPGIKSTGCGEMGDLEFFHLPIIFKSHVTGFEPTKDIYLEQGNVVAGQYLVENELGSAAFSTAYRCVDLSSPVDEDDEHEEVCLKVIKNTKDYFDQSLDEIKILELLRQTGQCHENYVVEMKTFFYHREHLVIVTELLRQNLFEFGKYIIEDNEETYFTIKRLAYITRQCLIALRFVHGLGLVHSDVKPENILLASYSRAKIKLIDFGSSCYLTDRQSSYIQSRSYRAPEVVLGLPYDGRIDVWSLGCVVAEMYTGEVTFQNDSVVSMLSRIEALCGSFPRHMIKQGRQSDTFFTQSGLLYEKVRASSDRTESNDSGSTSSNAKGLAKVDIFQPKMTTLAARLGINPEVVDRYYAGLSLSQEQTDQALFVDFCRQLLILDPEIRPTAAQALRHPWMLYAETLTEEEILYPSS